MQCSGFWTAENIFWSDFSNSCSTLATALQNRFADFGLWIAQKCVWRPLGSYSAPQTHYSRYKEEGSEGRGESLETVGKDEGGVDLNICPGAPVFIVTPLRVFVNEP